jgi:isopenicillin-N N-acyltransferase like protein
MAKQLPLVKLTGKPGEIGWQHGRQIKDRVRETWKFYSQTLFGNRLSFLQDMGNRYLEGIYGFSGVYGKEIEAIAAASGHKPWEIAALNARTEIFLRLLEENPPGECTAAYFPKTRVLGQNWDWMKQLEPLVVLMEIKREDGHKILQLAEPGIIGKIGFNSAGIGVCLNILTGKKSPPAVPVHVLLRAVLDGSSISDILGVFSGMRHGTNSNILMADDRGRFINMEFSGEKMKVVEDKKTLFLHTNHYLSDLADDHDIETDIVYPSSICRYTTGRDLLDGLGEDAGVPELKTVLMDPTGDPYPICAPYVNYFGFENGTVSSIIMDLPKRTMEITIGNPRQNAYRTASL